MLPIFKLILTPWVLWVWGSGCRRGAGFLQRVAKDFGQIRHAGALQLRMHVVEAASGVGADHKGYKGGWARLGVERSNDQRDDWD